MENTNILGIDTMQCTGEYMKRGLKLNSFLVMGSAEENGSVALCTRVLEPGARHKMSFGNVFWIHALERKSETWLVKIRLVELFWLSAPVRYGLNSWYNQNLFESSANNLLQVEKNCSCFYICFYGKRRFPWARQTSSSSSHSTCTGSQSPLWCRSSCWKMF